MEPRGLTLPRKIGLLACRQLSSHKLLLPLMKKSREFIFMWRREPGGRMQTQGRREAEQTLPGAGGVPPPLCEARRLARAFSGPRDSITVTAGRSAACRGQMHRIPSEGQRRRHSPQPTTQQGAGRPPRGRCCDCQRRPGTGGRGVSVSPSHPSRLRAWRSLAQPRTPSSAPLSSRSLTASKLSPSPPAQTLPLWAARPRLT